jgi:hypothetical protein
MVSSRVSSRVSSSYQNLRKTNRVTKKGVYRKMNLICKNDKYGEMNKDYQVLVGDADIVLSDSKGVVFDWNFAEKRLYIRYGVGYEPKENK